MCQIASTVKASRLDLKNSFSGLKVLLFRFAIHIVVCLPLLKTAKQSKKGSSGCATPKENKNIISAIVDKEHFLVFCCNSSLYLGHRPCQCNTTLSFHFKSTLGPTSSLWRGTYFFSRGFIISIIGFLLLSRQSSLCLLNLVSVCTDFYCR